MFIFINVRTLFSFSFMSSHYFFVNEKGLKFTLKINDNDAHPHYPPPVEKKHWVRAAFDFSPSKNKSVIILISRCKKKNVKNVNISTEIKEKCITAVCFLFAR